MRDNQPKHRQMRKEQHKLARQKASRDGLPAVLIVCEGRETEPNYIDGLRHHLRINNAAVRVIPGDSVTDSVGLVRKAQKLFKADGNFDLVYVVCDGESAQLLKANLLAKKVLHNAARMATRVQVIASWPSIEYWLLLHFEYSARSFQSAAEVITALRRHLTDYQKNDREIFRKVVSGVDLACQHATRLNDELARIGTSTPNTDMHLLVYQLERMRH
jgi:hypothetical protein